jgi:outer membrane lipoprotein-sorting protein
MMHITNQRSIGQLLAAIVVALLWLSSSASSDEAISPETRKVLDRIDQAGKGLVDLSADITQTKVTLVVNDTSTETGKLYLKRTKNNNKTRLEYEKPEAKTLLIDKGKVLIYEPKINRLQEIDLGKNRAQAEFLLTGVGQSSTNLTNSYDVLFLKEETVKSHKASLLELKPKSEKVSSMFSKIWLWIDHASGLPIQTRLTESSGDYLTFQLENIKVNPKLPDNLFKLNVPSGVQRIKPLSSS